jgi:hypothetical protein
MTGSIVPSMPFSLIKMSYANISRNATTNFSLPPSTSSSTTSPPPILKGQSRTIPRQKGDTAGTAVPTVLKVCIGLVATKEGLPIAFEIFDGNRTDVTTTQEMVLVMETKYGKANRIWVLDRGMVSEDNLEFMRVSGARYLVGTPKSLLKKFEQHLLNET